MLHFKRRYVWTLSCLSVLAGCAQLYSGQNHPKMNIHPVMRVQQADLSADRLYNLGRYHHRRTEYQDAILAYQQALDIDPTYIEAHNGLGIVYALLKQHALSLQHFRKAIALAPAATYLHSNIGYAFQLQDRYSEALEAYQEALRLDSDNHKARKNVANLSERLGLLATSEQTVPAMDEPGEEVAANAQKMTEPRHQAGSQLVQVAPNVYEFRNNEQVPKLNAAVNSSPKHAAGASELLTLNLTQRIEVSNGNGVTGMARKVARFLEQSGFPGARLTNHDNYNQVETVIHYRPGQQAQAEQMRKLMPNEAARSIESNHLREDVGVKILLGQDLNVAVDYFNIPLLNRLAYNQ